MTSLFASEKDAAGDALRNRSRNFVRNPLWRDGAMTDGHGPTDTVRAHLGSLARGPAADRLLERLARSGLVAGGPTDLVALLECRQGDRCQRAVLVECLAAWAPHDELAALALLHLLEPELDVVAARLARLGHVEPVEARGDVLGAAWEALTRRPPPGRPDRLEAIWSMLRQTTGLRRTRPGPLPDGFDIEAPEDLGSPERWPGLLDRAGSAGFLSCEEATLIARTRIEGEPLRSVARDLGRPYDALRMQRRRAEAALRAYVSSGASS